jgi:hypothetical protein
VSSWAPISDKRVSKPVERYLNPVNATGNDIRQPAKSKTKSTSSDGDVQMEYAAAPSEKRLEKIIKSGRGTLMEFPTQSEMEDALEHQGSSSIAFAIPNMNVGGLPYQVYSQPFPRVLTAQDELIASSSQAGLDTTMNTTSSRQITEVVGEDAAALYMMRHYSASTMVWGYANHSGPGIDQIWKSTDMKGVPTFYIVEAKGPGANLRDDQFVPSGFGRQMSIAWVLHHLVEMKGVLDKEKTKTLPKANVLAHYGVAADIMNESGLTYDSSVRPTGARNKGVWDRPEGDVDRPRIECDGDRHRLFSGVGGV